MTQRTNELGITPLFDSTKLRDAVEQSRSYTGVLRILGIRRSKNRVDIARRRVLEDGLSVAHFDSSLFSRAALTVAVANSYSWAEILRQLGLPPKSGGWHKHLKQKTQSYGLDTSHFTNSGWSKGRTTNRKRAPVEILVQQDPSQIKTPTSLLRRALIESGVQHTCASCGLGPEWHKARLVLQIDHRNGNNLDHRKENLRFLCPNCHSQTENYAGRGRARTRRSGGSETTPFGTCAAAPFDELRSSASPDLCQGHLDSTEHQ
jgi:hypothetical protein